ncbi:predicted protein [Thalassiosira pseudonana CCMP1335]|uniref:Uncharacterized protein n=1 Tax=Thalassiosira pseudonana TaxID=35128 RepID=B8C701_THAPS|nr:predicted protein [Thalassiosira pseudonana CCMP1335]EED90895.1 predicted protein [Thalassiosira pseudonana CCMP1335]
MRVLLSTQSTNASHERRSINASTRLRSISSKIPLRPTTTKRLNNYDDQPLLSADFTPHHHHQQQHHHADKHNSSNSNSTQDEDEGEAVPGQGKYIRKTPTMISTRNARKFATDVKSRMKSMNHLHLSKHHHTSSSNGYHLGFFAEGRDDEERLLTKMNSNDESLDDMEFGDLVETREDDNNFSLDDGRVAATTNRREVALLTEVVDFGGFEVTKSSRESCVSTEGTVSISTSGDSVEEKSMDINNESTVEGTTPVEKGAMMVVRQQSLMSTVTTSSLVGLGISQLALSKSEEDSTKSCDSTIDFDDHLNVEEVVAAATVIDDDASNAVDTTIAPSADSESKLVSELKQKAFALVKSAANLSNQYHEMSDVTDLEDEDDTEAAEEEGGDAVKEEESPSHKLASYHTPSKSSISTISNSIDRDIPSDEHKFLTEKMPIVVTATDHGDVILLTEQNVQRFNASNESNANGVKVNLEPDFYTSNVETNGARRQIQLATRLKIALWENRGMAEVSSVDATEAEQDENVVSPSHAARASQESEFFEFDDWENEDDDDDASNCPSPFGACTVNEEAKRSILNTAHATSPSLDGAKVLAESQTEVGVAISVPLIQSNNDVVFPTHAVTNAVNLLDVISDETSEEGSSNSSNPSSQLGSFNFHDNSPVVGTDDLSDSESSVSSDMESDVSGDYFDYNHEALADDVMNDMKKVVGCECIDEESVSVRSTDDDFDDSSRDTSRSDEDCTSSDALNNFWTHEWKEMTNKEDEIAFDGDVCIGIDEELSESIESECDYHAGEEEKVYEFGEEPMEYVQQRHQLETVEESVSGEEADSENSDGDSINIEEDANNNDATTTCNRDLPTQSTRLVFRCSKSTKKRYLCVKKRAVVNAKSKRSIKYGLDDLEKGSRCKNTNVARNEDAATPEVDDMLSDALVALDERESEGQCVDESVRARDSPASPCDESECLDQPPSDFPVVKGTDEDKTTKETVEDAKVVKEVEAKMEVKVVDTTATPDDMGILTQKLFYENTELVDLVVATQSELEVLKKKLEAVTMERDELITTVAGSKHVHFERPEVELEELLDLIEDKDNETGSI